MFLLKMHVSLLVLAVKDRFGDQEHDESPGSSDSESDESEVVSFSFERQNTGLSSGCLWGCPMTCILKLS